MSPSPTYTRVTLTAIAQAARAGSTTILDTLTRIAVSEGIPRTDVHEAIATGHQPQAVRR